MMAEVRLPTLLRVHADGAASVTVPGSTVGELFASVTAAHPGLADQLIDENGALHKFVNVYVNDDDIRYLDKLATPITDRDVISILPAVAGG